MLTTLAQSTPLLGLLLVAACAVAAVLQISTSIEARRRRQAERDRELAREYLLALHRAVHERHAQATPTGHRPRLVA